ncbi:hypothetical protein M0804_011265 [Polistes exclamans]|nr:hypothetical protein M0804_011265 [Polistes exclamans]
MAEGSWLLAIMRSSVFRSRTASPYRYVSPPSPVTLSEPPIWLSLEDQMASPIRVIPNILFLFRNQISQGKTWHGTARHGTAEFAAGADAAAHGGGGSGLCSVYVGVEG